MGTLPKIKADGKVVMEFGQLPVLEVNGKFFNQSNSILKLLGKKQGLYPTDPEEQWVVDSCIDSISDITAGIQKFLMGTTD